MPRRDLRQFGRLPSGPTASASVREFLSSFILRARSGGRSSFSNRFDSLTSPTVVADVPLVGQRGQLLGVLGDEVGLDPTGPAGFIRRSQQASLGLLEKHARFVYGRRGLSERRSCAHAGKECDPEFHTLDYLFSAGGREDASRERNRAQRAVEGAPSLERLFSICRRVVASRLPCQSRLAWVAEPIGFPYDPPPVSTREVHPSTRRLNRSVHRAPWRWGLPSVVRLDVCRPVRLARLSNDEPARPLIGAVLPICPVSHGISPDVPASNHRASEYENHQNRRPSSRTERNSLK